MILGLSTCFAYCDFRHQYSFLIWFLLILFQGLGAFGDDLADISLKVMEAIEFGIRQLRVTYMAYEVAVGLEAAVQGKGSHLPSITHGKLNPKTQTKVVTKVIIGRSGLD